jgi:hypothetical protein
MTESDGRVGKPPRPPRERAERLAAKRSPQDKKLKLYLTLFNFI